MTRKHLQVIAAQYGQSLSDFGVPAAEVEKGAKDLALSLKAFNPRLDVERFVGATLTAFELVGVRRSA